MSKKPVKKYQPRRPKLLLTNPEERICVKMGLARADKPDGRVEYDWEKINELWLADPAPTMLDFCRKYGLNYDHAHKMLKSTAVRKRAVHAVLRSGYMLSVVRRLTESNALRAEESAVKFEQTVHELMVFSRSAASFARARMMKMGPRGEEMVNVDAKATDVAYYARIARDASETLKNLLNLKITVGGTEDEKREVSGITIDAPEGTSEHEDSEQGRPEEARRPEPPPVRPDQAEPG